MMEEKDLNTFVCQEEGNEETPEAPVQEEGETPETPTQEGEETPSNEEGEGATDEETPQFTNDGEEEAEGGKTEENTEE